MVWKKEPDSYPVWVLYIVISVMGVFCAFSLMGLKLGLPGFAGLIASGGLIALETVFCVFLCKKKRENQKRVSVGLVSEEESRTYQVVQILIAVAVLAVGLFYRIYAVKSFLAGQTGETNFYFLNAAGLAKGETVSFVHGIEQYHVWILHKSLSFFGNFPSVAYFAMIVLQMASVWLLFFAAEMISGKFPALIGLVFLTFYPGMTKQILNLSPEVLFSFGASVGVLLSLLVLKGKRALALKAAIAGAYIGFFTYLDICAAGLIFLLFGRIGLRDANGNARHTEGVFCGVLGVVGAFAGFSLSLLMDTVYNDHGIDRLGSFLTAWRGIYTQSAGESVFGSMLSEESSDILGFGIAAVLLCTGIGSFLIEEEDHGRKLWTLELGAVLVPTVFRIATKECRAEMMILFCSALLIGLEADTFMGLKFFTKKPEQGDEDNSIHPEWEQDGTEEGIKDEAEPEKPKKSGNVITVTQEDGTQRTVKLLDNPMEVPKKKVHKAMDYDVEVSEDDDFDI